MQDNYTGDIGDYGKYGLLREICAAGLSLSANWYRVDPKVIGKQDDGKYIEYLSKPQVYRDYDPALFDALHRIVKEDDNRRIARIEQARLFGAVYFSTEICTDRAAWHRDALERTHDTDVVFLDPDNGLETFRMHQMGGATEKHVKWAELKDYYTRGQSVVLYQHRPQMTAKSKCIEDIMHFQETYLLADCIKLLEFPKYTNRFYFMFLHQSHKSVFDRICRTTAQKWGKDGFCREILVD